MSEKEKKEEYGESEDRGGRKEGGTPDYEKNQSSPISEKDFDNSKSAW